MHERKKERKREKERKKESMIDDWHESDVESRSNLDQDKRIFKEMIVLKSQSPLF